MMQRPRMQVAAVTIGAPDPRALAAFYERMLGWRLVNEEAAGPGDPPEDVWAQLRPPPGETGPTLNFEFERHYVPPVWPSVVGEQHITEHLDIAVDDLNETVAWAVAAGATLGRLPTAGRCAGAVRPGRAPVLSVPDLGVTPRPFALVRAGWQEVLDAASGSVSAAVPLTSVLVGTVVPGSRAAS